MNFDSQAFADRYAALWNDPNPETRRASIDSLWSNGGSHHVRSQSAHGHEALERRISGAYEKNVRDAGYEFRAVQNAQRLKNVVTFNWEMVDPASGRVAATGLEFIDVDANGQIVTDYQFIV